MISYRQYILTLMAVFLALTLGIFVGNAVLGEDLLVVQQQEIIGRLEDDFKLVKKEQRVLQDKLAVAELYKEHERQLADTLLPCLVNSKVNTKVVIINISEREVDSDLIKFLGDVGIETVTSIGLANNDLRPEDDGLYKALVDRYRQNLSREEVIGYLAEAVIGNRSSTLLEYLAEEGWIRCKGEVPSHADAILLVGGFENSQDLPLDLVDHLISSWQRNKVSVAIVSNVADDSSYLSDYKKYQEIFLIDHFDTLAGKLSLLYFLEGNNSGNFGMHKGSQGLFPIEWLRESMKSQW